MIGRLHGTLIEKQPPYILLDVQGVGYELQVPMTTLYHLPAVGEQTTLHTHFSVSETAQQLFGFVSLRDRQLFRMLIKVSGVGPKMAVGIMSMDSDDFVRCVMDDNVAALVKVPGVGKKTAERLIVEMRDKLKDWSIPTPAVDEGIVSVETPRRVSANTIVAEAESALVALGYKPAEAARAINAVPNKDRDSSESLIRAALRSMIPA